MQRLMLQTQMVPNLWGEAIQDASFTVINGIFIVKTHVFQGRIMRFLNGFLEVQELHITQSCSWFLQACSRLQHNLFHEHD